MNESSLIQKVWNYATVLKNEGVHYGAYISQISFLLFLKMDDEAATRLGEPSALPEDCRWSVIRDYQGEALAARYGKILSKLSREDGLIGAIFLKAQNEIQDPAKLRRLVTLIGEETWLGLDIDTKGAIYEGLLERNAAEVKSGAGQYFTPRPLIDVMTAVIDPQPEESVHDPACGTGGFLLATWERMKANPRAKDRRLQQRMRARLSGVDIVPDVVRLCAMNMYLHGAARSESMIDRADALIRKNGEYDVVLTNPPFGKKQGYRIVGPDGEIETEREEYNRPDFIKTTSNKQLNFLQHIMSILKIDGRCGVVLPDNVLFEGAGADIRKRLLDNYDFHTLLRLPTGIFYKQGVKANVLFFDRKPASEEPWTKELWIYDLRTNMGFTQKERPMKRPDLDDFVASYCAANRTKRKESDRFRRYTYDQLLKRDKFNLDIFWLKDDSLDDPDLLPAPDEIAAEIVESLETALEKFRKVAATLQPGSASLIE
ncbi:MAG: N-6 DNA methylase [Hyphomicrobiales bacterium]|nr:N-6 DNA methylase [Hyphomicrobiales bacterium]MBV8825990.1 N-6 DNA methylase [Hyphomicrobiales bacterium]MBV9428523.1 N-6 DNA methylase [Bradyrhizobiaceae bacterium]